MVLELQVVCLDDDSLCWALSADQCLWGMALGLLDYLLAGCNDSLGERIGDFWLSSAHAWSNWVSTWWLVPLAEEHLFIVDQVLMRALENLDQTEVSFLSFFVQGVELPWGVPRHLAALNSLRVSLLGKLLGWLQLVSERLNFYNQQYNKGKVLVGTWLFGLDFGEEGGGLGEFEFLGWNELGLALDLVEEVGDIGVRLLGGLGLVGCRVGVCGKYACL